VVVRRGINGIRRRFGVVGVLVVRGAVAPEAAADVAPAALTIIASLIAAPISSSATSTASGY
jgi:hypothetical protein